MIATIFNGSGNIDNLVPMDSNLNRGKWKVMENEWKLALSPPEPQKVEVKIKPIYGNDSQRPESFEVKYKIGDGSWIEDEFINKNQKEN